MIYTANTIKFIKSMYKSPKKDNNNEADYFFCYSLYYRILISSIPNFAGRM